MSRDVLARELIKEQENLLAVEKFAGNIVKQELHRGVIIGVKLMLPHVQKLIIDARIEELERFHYNGDLYWKDLGFYERYKKRIKQLQEKRDK